MRTILALSLALLLIGCNEVQQESEPNDDLGHVKQAAPAQPADMEIWFEPILQAPMKEFAGTAGKSLGLNISLKGVGRVKMTKAALGEPENSQPQVYIFSGNDVMKELLNSGSIEESTLRTFAGDRLALIQVKDRGYKAHSLFDVYKLRFEGIGVLTPDSAMGKYANQALVSSGANKKLEGLLVEFNSLMQLLEALRQDEVQMAIVPSSIVVQSTDLDPLLIIEEDTHEDIRYQAAAATGYAGDESVVKVLALLAEDEGIQQLFIGLGLVDRRTALVEDK